MTDYWAQRKHMSYYQVALRLALQYCPEGQSVLDVGSGRCSYITQLESFSIKHAVDLERDPSLPGVTGYHCDFLQFQPQLQYDLVLCLQVLEHLQDPIPFANKLLHSGKVVVISVPHMWAQGGCKYHPQDPIGRQKLQSWTGPWEHLEIVCDDRVERMLAVYRC